MGANWEPDDSTVEGPGAIGRIKAALEKHGVAIEGVVVTSRHPRMNLVRHELMRANMPPGIMSWQLPVFGTGPVFTFITVASPGAVVPEHTHQRPLLRMVISGTLIFEGIELGPGDWMYVPKGVPYSYSAGWDETMVSCHSYG